MLRKEMKESNKTIIKEEKTTSEQLEGEWIFAKNRGNDREDNLRK